MDLVRRIGAFALVAAAIPAWGGPPASKPGVFEARTETVTFPRGELHLTLVTPAKPKPPALLVLFASGDAGWMGACGAIFEHLAESGRYVAAFDSREVVAAVKRADALMQIPDAAADVDALIVRSRSALGLPENAPVIVTGYSRGATFVVLTAGVKSLQRHLAGAAAIALTREADFLRAPPADKRPPEVQVDAKGRIQTYPAITLAGPIPFAVIQSKGDKYVPAEEARALFGPDSATRRLYEVDATNHGFSGGRDALLRDLDDALGWIEGMSAAR